jgi:hypothetical protein
VQPQIVVVLTDAKASAKEGKNMAAKKAKKKKR